MRLVQVVTADEGGGGRAAYRLHDGLCRIGADSTLYVATKCHPDSATVVFQPSEGRVAKFQRYLRRTYLTARRVSYQQIDRPWNWDSRCQHGGDPLAQLPSADVVNLHTISNFFDYTAYFQQFAPRVHTVWTLHLMSPFTGGCNYSYGCKRFQQECGGCPFLHPQREHDLSRTVWQEKNEAYGAVNSSQLHLIAPSRWLAGEVRSSSLLGGFPLSVIPYGVDTQAYTPRDRKWARETLGIAQDAAVVLFVTQHSFDVKAKGFSFLIEALAGMTEFPGLHLLTLGGGGGDLERLRVRHTHLGHVFNDRLLSLVYSAADIFAIPSLQDNLPNVVLEALACGLPAVGFDIGGLPEMIRPGQTGELAAAGDVTSLREAMTRILGNAKLRAEMSSRCREIAVAEYGLELQAREYLKVYEHLLSKTTNAQTLVRLFPN